MDKGKLNDDQEEGSDEVDEHRSDDFAESESATSSAD